MYFADANHGWLIAGSPDLFGPMAAVGVALPLYKTVDGGLTWVPVPTKTLLRSPDGAIGRLFFIDQNTGFMARWANSSNYFSQLLKTTDGGRTWTVVVQAPQAP